MGNYIRKTDEAGLVGNTGGCVRKAYDIAELGNGELEINMYGEVVQTIPVNWWTGKQEDGLYICEKDFLNDLEKYKNMSKITVRINSVGGDLYAGLAIANRMKDLDAEIVTIVDALCASAAVAIQQAGSTRKVYKGSQVMIHEPSCYIYGRYDVQGLKKVEKQLEAGKKSIIKVYEERTGKSEEDLDRMVTENSWLTGQEAIDEGFADELMEGEVSAGITEDRKTVISNGIGFPASAFFAVPGNLPVIKNGVVTGKEKPATIKTVNEGGNTRMTRKELMESQPDLYNEVIQEAQDGLSEKISAAVESERKRIREIDEIANAVGDETLVENAKFGEKPMNASQLALVALKRQNEIGARFLDGMKNDIGNSGVENVKPTPNSGQKSKEEQEMQDIMDAAVLIAGCTVREGDTK